MSRKVAAFALHIGSVIAANVLTAHFGLVPVGFGLLVTAGTFAAGFALLARDILHRVAGVRWVLASIAVGGVMSWLLADPMIAVASTVAFLVAEIVDLAVFVPIRERRGFVPAALVSNVISAPVDTVAFLWLAGFPLTLEAVGGQFIGKVWWATVIPLAVWVVSRAVFRHHQQSRRDGRHA